jgi:hypothetical protein
MGGKDGHGVDGHFLEFFHEYRAFVFEAGHHGLIMDDLVPHVYGRAETLDGLLDDADGALDAGAEAARGCQINLHR